MPNRYIREGFLDSKAINQLTDFAECFYHRLLIAVDDAGRFDGRSQVIANKLWPCKNVSKKEVDKALEECIKTGLLIIYLYNDQSYLQLVKCWRCGNAKFSKYPDEDGKFKIEFEVLETRDGEKEYVKSSIVCDSVTKEPHADGVLCNPGYEEMGYRRSTLETVTETVTVKYSEESSEVRLSSLLFNEIKKNDQKAKKPNFQKWAEHIDKLMRIDKRTEQEITEVIRWCQNDNFWKTNILSTQKLRGKFSQLLLRMKNPINQKFKPPEPEQPKELSDADFNRIYGLNPGENNGQRQRI